MAAQTANYHSVRSKAKISFTEDGSLINDYLVLNMEQSAAQHLKDAVPLTATNQGLICFSLYTQSFWLLVPG